MAPPDGQRPSNQTDNKARMAGIRHCKSKHTPYFVLKVSGSVRIGILVALCHWAGLFAAPVYERARRQVGER